MYYVNAFGEFWNAAKEAWVSAKEEATDVRKEIFTHRKTRLIFPVGCIGVNGSCY